MRKHKRRTRENQKTVTGRIEELRKNATFAEKHFKKQLDQMKISYKFQKGFISGYYAIVDFYIPRLHLCVEIDGEYHNEPEQKRKDLYRDNFLETNRNVRTIRISNKVALSMQKQDILRILGLKYDCNTCLHGLVRCCTDRFENGCSFWYSPKAKDREQGIAFQPWKWS